MSDDKLNPIHPGEVLLEEFLKPMQLSQYRLAKDIGVPARRVNEIVLGKRGITTDTALRFSRYLGTSDRFWLDLQVRVVLETERDRTKVEPWRAGIEASADSEGSPNPQQVEQALAKLGPQFPRNGKMCWEFNRICEHADLCYSRNADAAVGYRVKGHRVTEEEIERATRPDVAEVADFGG